MKTDPKILKLKAKLEKVKAPKNWGEITGPFFHLKLPGTPASGPYMQAGIKALTEENEFPEDTVVRDAKNIGEWIGVYAHPAFQRRKPQIIGEEKNLPDDRKAYILVNGQKHGPLGTQEVIALLEQKEILLTDQVSFDEGHSWRKLYEFQEFDRRDLEQSHLPSIPTWDVFKNSNEEIDDQLSHAQERERQLNAFAGLAFIENVQAEKSTDQNLEANKQTPEVEETHKGADIVEFKLKEKQVSNSQEQQDDHESSPWTKNLAYVVAICFMLGASSYMLFNDPMKDVNLLSDRQQAAKKLIKRGTPTKGRVPASQQDIVKRAQEQTKKAQVSRVNKIRRAPSRRPASITETKSFREGRKMQERPFMNNEDPYQDDAYEDYNYDDGSTPVAQDRVRKRLDKRTIDSEDQYYDSNQKEEFIESEIDTAQGVWGEADEGRVPQSEDQGYEDNYGDEGNYQDDVREAPAEPEYDAGGYDQPQEQVLDEAPQGNYQVEEPYESYDQESYDDASMDDGGY